MTTTAEMTQKWVLQDLRKDLRRVRGNIKRNLQAGALAELSYERDRQEELRLVRDIARRQGKGAYQVQLRCGHNRTIFVGSEEEAYMEAHGIVQCLSPRPSWVYGNGQPHRGEYIGILGWKWRA